MVNDKRRCNAQVIRDVRDARKDYMIPQEHAQELLKMGKLMWCGTNHAYLTLKSDMPPIHMGEWCRRYHHG